MTGDLLDPYSDSHKWPFSYDLVSSLSDTDNSTEFVEWLSERDTVSRNVYILAERLDENWRSLSLSCKEWNPIVFHIQLNFLFQDFTIVSG